MSVGKTVSLFFKHHKLRFLFIILSITVVTLLSLVPAQILRIIVDEIIPSNDSNRLLLVALSYAGIYLLIGVSTFVKDIIMLSTSSYITKELRSNMMKKVDRLSYQTLVNSDSGTLEAYFNNDVQSLNELFTSGVVNMATDLIKMIGIVISIFIYSMVFGYIVLAIIPILVLFTSIVRKGMLRAQLKTKSLEGNVNKDLLENVESIEQLKVNKAEEYAIQKYDKILNNHFLANQKSNFYDAIFSPVMQIIRNAVVCGVLLVSGFNASIFGMTIGMIISAITLLTDLFQPIENLGMEIQTIQKSVAAVKRINNFFQLKEKDITKYTSLSDISIDYQHVCFSYEEKEVIKDFTLSIRQGDKIAFHGPSGAGKSTLMKLAMGILSPTVGSVLIGGCDASSFNEEMRRKLFAIVYQDPFFSGDSINEEITLCDTTISRKSVKEALALVGLDYISNIDSILNPKEYSSGELALFNIARVIVRNPKIIFIDEMNAKIDPLTGEKMIHLINQLSTDKIVISINHYGTNLKDAKIIEV